MNTSESINQALELGADDYLTKPIDDPVFYAKLERLLGLISDDSIKLEYAKVPPAYSGGHIMLNFEINKINEFGITLHCPYYIASGTPLVLKSDLWTEVIGVDQLPVLSIHQCRVLDDGKYEVYLEFDALNTQLLADFRLWLSKRN